MLLLVYKFDKNLYPISGQNHRPASIYKAFFKV